jgi:simple sugar transport system substrate-binding protein/basic membrane protein A
MSSAVVPQSPDANSLISQRADVVYALLPEAGFAPTSAKEMRMRKIALTLLAAVVAVASLSAGGSAQGGKVAMLLPGSINDQSWNAAGYAGLQKLKGQGMEVAYSENVQAADHIEAMKDYARKGFSPVIGHSGRFLSAAQRVGPEFEKTIFFVGSGSGGAKNVISVDIANEQFGYLVGVLAGRMTKSNKVGAVAGLEGLPNMVASMGGFRLGVKSVRPNAEVRIIYLQSMEDPAAAKEAAFSLIAAGADVVAGKLNAGHAGLIQAAKEKGVWATGRSFGHTAIAPERVLTNINEKWDDVYVAAVGDLKANKIKSAHHVYGYHTPAARGADLQYNDKRAYNDAVPGPVIEEIDGLKKKIASGELKIQPTKEDARGGA